MGASSLGVNYLITCLPLESMQLMNFFSPLFLFPSAILLPASYYSDSRILLV